MELNQFIARINEYVEVINPQVITDEEDYRAYADRRHTYCNLMITKGKFVGHVFEVRSKPEKDELDYGEHTRDRYVISSCNYTVQAGTCTVSLSQRTLDQYGWAIVEDNPTLKVLYGR